MAKVFANGRSIVHKGDGQINTAAPPDVCKTPSPGGPVPTPYVNVARNSDLSRATKTVKIAGTPAGNADSNLATSAGNEAGTAGGGLMSSKIKGKLTWATSSPTVKLEGKGAVRFMDVTQHNGNSFNTAFKEQGGTGIAYGDDFEGQCPLCNKSADKHRIMEMRESSAKIAADILKRLHANPERYAKTQRRPSGIRLKGYMVGVLVCDCKVLATTSGSTPEHFPEAAQGCAVIGGGGVNAYQLGGHSDDALAEVANRIENIQQIRASSDKQTKELREQTSPEGECAAQKLIARAKGHAIRSMTEVMWQPQKRWKQQYVIKMTSRAASGRTKMRFEDFTAADAAADATNKSVGSCHACQLVLPLLLCDLRTWAC